MSETQSNLEGEPLAELAACLAGLVNVVDKGTAAEVGPYNLIPLEFNLLQVCMERGECTATQLAEVLPVDASRISRVVNRLVEMDLLSRRRLRDDRRVVMLTLTEHGQELTSQVHERVQLYEARLMEGVTDEAMRVFVDTTFKIISNYEALQQPDPPIGEIAE